MPRLNIKSTKADAIELLKKITPKEVNGVGGSLFTSTYIDGYTTGIVEFCKQLGIEIKPEDYK